MKKFRILALLVALLMMTSAALAESAGDPAVVKAGNVSITLSEVQEYFDEYYAQLAALYEENGIILTRDQVEALRDAVVEVKVEEAVQRNKAEELGLGEITEEDKEALFAEIEASFEADLASYAEAVGVTVDEIRSMYTAEGIDAQMIYELNLQELPRIRLFEQTVADVAVTPAEIDEEYAAYVEEDKGVYGNDAASYEMNAVMYGASEPTYYVPEGFRYIKHILLSIPEDITAELNDFDTEMQSAQTMISTLTEELATAEDDKKEEIETKIAEQQDRYDEFVGKYEETSAGVLPALQPTIDEIYERLAGGASFDELVAEYNTDPGMVEGFAGYEVHKDSIRYDTLFRDAAMDIAELEGVSDPVLTDFGVHIIQYAGDVPGGAAEMTDAVRAEVEASLLSAKQEEAFNAAYQGWLSETEVETHPELIVLPEAPDAEEAAPVEEEVDETEADVAEEATG